MHGIPTPSTSIGDGIVPAQEPARRIRNPVSATLALVGRVLFAALFIAASPRHFSPEGIHHASELGTPYAQLLVPLSGLMALVGGLSVAFGYRARLGAWMLVAFLIPVTLIMHGFWQVHDPAQHQIQASMFSKNLALIGAALFVAHFGAGDANVAARVKGARRAR
jgi:putative oxidoreductase